METLVLRQKSLLKRMLATKKQVEAHVKNPTTVPKPDNVEFVKPFTLPATGK